MDLLMDINGTGDMVFVNGAAPRTYIEADVVAQRLAIHLRTFRAEWFLDEPYGVPWFEILGTKKTKQQVDAILQREVLSVQGVREIVSCRARLITSTETIAVNSQLKQQTVV